MEESVQKDESGKRQEEVRDEVLWKKAKRRASFRYHALIYFIINLFFWTMYISVCDHPMYPRTIEALCLGPYGP